MKALISEGLTIGELVDEVVNDAAVAERRLVVKYIRNVAAELPNGQQFPPNLASLVTDLLLDISDDIEECEHFSDGGTIQ